MATSDQVRLLIVEDVQQVGLDERHTLSRELLEAADPRRMLTQAHGLQRTATGPLLHDPIIAALDVEKYLRCRGQEGGKEEGVNRRVEPADLTPALKHAI